MTEAEWLACDDPEETLDFLRGQQASDRKLRLFAVACCRRLWHLVGGEESWKRAVEVAEQYADSLATGSQRSAARRAVASRDNEALGGMLCAAVKSVVKSIASEAAMDSSSIAANAAASALMAARSRAVGDDLVHANYETAFESERTRQAVLLRDIFGNPFRPVTCHPEWRTDTALSLARGMYESRDFSAMPILADALQDAGCDGDDILSHCRSDGPHVRGCWAVDLVLGKE